MAEKGFGVKEINLIGASGTPTIESPNNLNLNAVNVAISTNATIGGNLTVTGNIGIAGTLTYEDVTNVDAVGIITAREGVFIPDNKELKIGNTASSPDLKIYHNTSNTLIENSTGQLALSNSDGNISIKATDSNGDIIMRVGGSTSSENAIVAVHHGEVILSCNGATRLTTTSTGITVAGTAVATTFSGSGASLTNLPAANLTGTLPAISGANLTNLPASTPADTDVQITFDISASGSSGYIFTGPGNDGSTVNPDIYLVRGQRYRFINTTGSSHPFEFRNAANNADYTDGITGSQSGTQDFNVQYDAPAQLKYRCTIHTGSMQGNIYIVGQQLLNGSNNRVVTALGAYGLNGESGFTFDGTTVQIPDRMNLNTNGSYIKENQLSFSPSGTAFIDHGVTGQDIQFRTSVSSALDTSSVKITSAGNIAFGINGRGIDFSVASGLISGRGTSTSHILDDYEEGDYTPTFTVQSGTVTLDSNTKTLSYTKIGRQVTIIGQLKIASVSNPSGIFRASLPFARANQTEQAERTMGNIMVNGAAVNNMNEFATYPDGGVDSYLEIVSISGTSISRNGGQNMQANATIIVNYTYFSN